tara:strand:+ start:337 stop:648 length:312 start_codon:yes stop_codon:yes gene_type:complete
MKDKRTYTNAKEHGEDMSLENEINIKHESKEDRGPKDLSLLNEQHKAEVWEWKKRESEWIQTKNLFEGSKKIINEMGAKIIKQTEIIKQLEQEIERLLAENKK